MENTMIFIFSSIGAFLICIQLFFFLFSIWLDVMSSFGRDWTMKKYTQQQLDYFKKLEYKGII